MNAPVNPQFDPANQAPFDPGAEAAEQNPTPPRSGGEKCRVFILDDHPLFRFGLKRLIDAQPDMMVCGEAQDGVSALDEVLRLSPDLITVDISLNRSANGIEFVKNIRAQLERARILVLSMHDEAVYAERALSAGSLGYVTKQQLDDTVLGAIRGALAGEIYMSEALQRRLAERYIGRRTLETSSPIYMLSDRELQVFRLIGQGRTTRQIAGTLNRSVKTIESHLEHIKNRLGIGSAAQLAQRATQWVETGRIG
jgi:DNA-binding NarL/FixJ family response regulator